MNNNFSIDTKSPIIIISILSILGGLAVMIYPDLALQYGMSANPASINDRILQFLLYSFLHGGILHILSNVLFFIVIGRGIEITHGKLYTSLLWLWTTIFVGVVLMYFSEYYTIGGSGFAMALLSVFAFDLYRRKNQDYRGAILLIVINILVGFNGEISLLGHLSGAIAGGLFALIYRR